VARKSITIVLELDDTADTPVGSARLLDGPCRTFHGWLGLAEAIDSLAGMTAPGGAKPSEASRHAEPDRTERSSSS
jgi:hypothetical protein